jgi:hypothetical protein
MLRTVRLNVVRLNVVAPIFFYLPEMALNMETALSNNSIILQLGNKTKQSKATDFEPILQNILAK